MRCALIALASLAIFGCIDPEEPSTSFLRPPPPHGALPPMDPASTEAAARVDTLGRRILAANPGIGGKPMFNTIGAPQPEVFHRGTDGVFVTEGLVRLCSDEQLAAVLSLELAKMVRDREAATPANVRTREPMAPIDMRLGNDDRMGGTADRTDLHEYVKYDAERKARRSPPKLPEPQILAQDYLRHTGFRPESIADVDPILKAATAQSGLEKQMTSGPGQ
jgi:hypothetical protein